MSIALLYHHFVFCNFVLSLLIGCGLWYCGLVPSYHCHHFLASSFMFVFLFIVLVYRVTYPPIHCLIYLPILHNSYSCSCLSTYSTFLFILLFSSLFLCILLFKLSHPPTQSNSLILTFSLCSHLSSYSSFLD